MRDLFYILAIFACSAVSFAFGTGQGYKTAETLLESRVVESYQSGDPFAFVNGQPVVIVATVRSDTSTVYNAMRGDSKEYVKTVEELPAAPLCGKCHSWAREL